MTEDDVRNGFAMPIYNPAYPPGPYRFIDREYLIITYRTDPAILEKVIPAPLKMTDPIVKYEFINMRQAQPPDDAAGNGLLAAAILYR